MAIIQCQECHKEISDKAAACPHCGAPRHEVKQQAIPIDKARKKKSDAQLAMLLVGASIAIGGMYFYKATHPRQRSAAEIMMEQRQAATWNVAETLKKTRNDPDSFKVSGASADAAGSIICIEYRARNGFGAVMPGQFVYDNGQAFDGENEYSDRCIGNDVDYDMLPTLSARFK